MLVGLGRWIGLRAFGHASKGIRTGHGDTAKVVVQCKLDPYRRSAAHLAILHGDVDALKKVLLREPDSIYAMDINHESPYTYAARMGQIEALRVLCDQNSIPLAVRDITGRTPLHYACLSRKWDMVGLLLSHSESHLMHIPDINNVTPSHLLAKTIFTGSSAPEPKHDDQHEVEHDDEPESRSTVLKHGPLLEAVHQRVFFAQCAVHDKKERIKAAWAQLEDRIWTRCLGDLAVSISRAVLAPVVIEGELAPPALAPSMRRRNPRRAAVPPALCRP